jgi:hypothetical protein
MGPTADAHTRPDINPITDNALPTSTSTPSKALDMRRFFRNGDLAQPAEA